MGEQRADETDIFLDIERACHLESRKSGGDVEDEPELLEGSFSEPPHEQMHVHVKTALGDTYTIAVGVGATVAEIKAELQKVEGTESGRQKLSTIAAIGSPAKQLSDDCLLAECSVDDGCVLLLENIPENSNSRDDESGQSQSAAAKASDVEDAQSALSEQNLRRHDATLEKQIFFSPPVPAVESWLTTATLQSASREAPAPAGDGCDEGNEMAQFLSFAGLLDADVNTQPMLSSLASLGVEAVEDFEVL